MPKFFFDLSKNGNVSLDLRGQDFHDAHRAHREAIAALAEIAGEEIPKDGPLTLAITVSDADHLVLFRTSVTFEPTV